MPTGSEPSATTPTPNTPTSTTDDTANKSSRGNDVPARSLYNRNRNERDARLYAILMQQSVLSADTLLAAKVQSNDDTLDQRHNLALVARPPQHIIALITALQQQLHTLAGDALWLPPPSYLHLTVFEVTHSRTSEQLQPLVRAVRSHGSRLFDALPVDRVKLDSPLLNCDNAAVALTFLPVDVDGNDITTLRAEVSRRMSALGLKLDGRYVLSSAHVTIGKFIKPQLQHATMEQWLARLEQLREECKGWQGEWCLADGPLQVMTDKSWYGGGTVVIEATHE